MTNREKFILEFGATSQRFKEIFGFTPSMLLNPCPRPKKICEEQRNCINCPFKHFWDEEYRECFKIKEEYEDVETT